MIAPLPRAILFDLDDTIVCYAGVSRQAWLDAITEYADGGSRYDTEALFAAIEVHSRWYWSDPERHRQGRLDIAGTRRMQVTTAMRTLGMRDEQLACAVADSFTRRREAAVAPFPGALETLTELHRRGVTLVLVTNGERRAQRAKVERFGLERFFCAVQIEQEAGVGKPEPQAYQRALRSARVQPAEAWFVGDNLEWDIAAPQRLGIFSVWNDWKRTGLPRESTLHPDLVINAISELL